jgi:ring-1,2-phenylacetyl-CoA epoxidase subunit PaaD
VVSVPTRSRTDPRAVAARVLDPELPMLTLEDLGVLREVWEEDGRVVVTITPTYSGCPALATMRADLELALARAGYEHVEVRTSLSPAWSSDDLTDQGRRRLAAAGIAAPGPVRTHDGPVPLTLTSRPPDVRCPRCGSTNTHEDSHFGATACKALFRCLECAEPFEHFKEL